MDGGDAYEVRIGYTPSRTFTDALQLTLNLLSANQEATILASPQVLAQDGVELETNASPTRNISNNLRHRETSSNRISRRSRPERSSASRRASATTGSITLSLELEVSDVVARGQQDLPVVNRRAARSTIRLENGGTAAVAGLVDNRSETTETGVPGSAPIALPWPGLSHRQAAHIAQVRSRSSSPRLLHQGRRGIIRNAAP